MIFLKKLPKKKERETQEQNQSIRSYMRQRIELQEGSNEHFHMKHKGLLKVNRNCKTKRIRKT